MDDLRDGIRVHHSIAEACLAADDPEAEIRSRLSEWFYDRVRAHGLDWSQEQMKQVLSIDLELNTQGLLAWQERQP
jgi:hypothetical protein